MTVMRFDPFRDFDRLGEQVRGRARSALPIDAVRRADEVVVHVDLPGVDPATIEVTVEKNLLTVSGERHSLRTEGDEVFVSERPTGRFSRQVRLGDGLDVGRVHASYDLGVLTVTLPLGEEVRPRRVEIQTVTTAGPAVDVAAPEAPAAETEVAAA